MVEYVSLGDFQTAVGFLLASTPERSIRYYRDALCTLALAVRPLLFSKCPLRCARCMIFHTHSMLKAVWSSPEIVAHIWDLWIAWNQGLHVAVQQ